MLAFVALLPACFGADGRPGEGSGAGGCEPGSDGCSCRADDSCASGLSCVDGLCRVEEEGDGDGEGELDDGNDDATGSGGGDDASCADRCVNGSCNAAQECECELGYTGPDCDAFLPSCAAILAAFPDAADGPYTLHPPGAGPFEGWCDQSTDGGGWLVVFKNQGGAQGSAASNLDLLEGDPVGLTGAIAPHTVSLGPGINLNAWNYYRGESQREWLKTASLWDANDNLVNEQRLRFEFGAVTWAWILSLASEESCHVAPNPITVVANGDVPLGQTDRVNSYQPGRLSFGLASALVPEDTCGQPESNLIADPEQVLFRLDGTDTRNTIRHVFSYVHDATGINASRCMYACWDLAAPTGHYEGFTWLVR